MSGSEVTTRPKQTKSREYMRAPSLLGSVFSPYFQRLDMRKKAPSRDTKLSLYIMARIGMVFAFQGNGTNGLDIYIASQDDTAPFTGHGSDLIGTIDLTGVNSQAGIWSQVVSIANTFASNNGFTFSQIYSVFDAGGMVPKTFANPSLAVNTSRRASTTRDAFVSASVDITASLSLAGGQTGKVELKYADDSAFTTNVVTVNPASNGNTGTLTIGLGLTQLGTATVCGMIPANKYYRLVTTSVTGTPTFGTPVLQEVLL